jgi:hypothetical protein
MNYDIQFRLDRAYMSESYDQARRYGSRWFIGEKLIGTFFLILGVILLVYVRGETVLPIVLVVIGSFELTSSSIKKYFWLKRHSKSKLNNAEIQITLSDSGIESRTLHSSGEMNWNGVEKVKRTPKGILVWPQKGIYWYLPESIAGAEAIDFIKSKIA